MNPEFWLAAAAFVTAVGGVIVGVISARSSAKKGDIEKVVAICDQLQEENGRLVARLGTSENRLVKVENENLVLRNRLALAEQKLGLAESRVEGLKIELSESYAGLRGRLESTEQKLKLAEGRVEALESELDELYSGLRLLVRQILDSGMRPVWLPTKMQGELLLQDMHLP
jgi:chromosome segregation ATPase